MASSGVSIAEVCFTGSVFSSFGCFCCFGLSTVFFVCFTGGCFGCCAAGAVTSGAGFCCWAGAAGSGAFATAGAAGFCLSFASFRSLTILLYSFLSALFVFDFFTASIRSSTPKSFFSPFASLTAKAREGVQPLFSMNSSTSALQLLLPVTYQTGLT